MLPLRETAGRAQAVLRGTFHRFLDARGLDLAGSLAYSSLLTIVPLMAAVTFLTSTVFGATGSGLYRVIRWIVPGAARAVLDAIQTFAHQATTLAGTASIFFLAASIRTFFQLEGAAKRLWGTTVHPRPLLARLGIALALMVAGPVALAIGTSFLLESGARFDEFRWLGFVGSGVLLLLLYRILPGARVRWGPAVAAALLSAVGLTILRIVFARSARILTTFRSTMSYIYGPISATVIFILAVGIAFAIFLLGVAFAHAIQFREELSGYDAPARTGHGLKLYEAVSILMPLATAWEADRASRLLPAIAEAVQRPRDEVESVLASLVEDGMARRDPSGAYVLSRPPDEISVWAVARAIGESAPRTVPAEKDPVATTLREVFIRATREERGVLQGTSLKDLLRPVQSVSTIRS
ncbi:MAG: YhjD/YihY/BrkB family envelope integrity protein [Thermoanaerobaculia bacterium]